MEKTKLQWHPAFGAALRITLQDEMKYLEMHEEYLLSKKPRTVLSYVREEALFDVIEPISDLDAIKGGSEPMMIALDADKSNLEIAMVMAPKQISEHMDTADNTQINFGARTAGLLVYHEQAITYIKQSE